MITLVEVFIELNPRGKLGAKFLLFPQSHLLTVCDLEIWTLKRKTEDVGYEERWKMIFSYRNILILELGLFDLSLPIKGV